MTAEVVHTSQPVATVIISVALMLFSGFLMTRITRLAKLPNVTAYILAGILIGPYCLNLVPRGIIDGMDFLSDIALAFISFSTGEFFKLDVLKKNGMKVVIITIFEAVLASVAETVARRFMAAGVTAVYIQWGLLIAFAVTMCLAVVFRYGVKLQRESDETL